MSIKRTRLSSEASRGMALEAARSILIDEGPQAVTLKNVAGRIGRTHANLLHHFGSAAELQQALAASMAERITTTIGEAVTRARAGEIDHQVVVDLTFDAFEKEGAGALASWAILTGQPAALDPVLDAINHLVVRLGPDGDRPVAAITLTLVLMALGDSLLGSRMADALGLSRGTARTIARAAFFPLPR